VRDEPIPSVSAGHNEETGVQQHHIAANGITLHVVEFGTGPAVLFCHGFPDTWRGWRRQMEAVAAAGYRAVALDMRGYGESSAPGDAALYTPFYTVGDLIGVLDALGAATATIVGHNFGASVAWNAAMMRPDRFTAVFCLSVPFLPPSGISFLQQLREAGRDDFYMFRQMRPEAEAEWADAATTIPGMYYCTSGSAPADQRWDPFDPALGLTLTEVPAILTWIARQRPHLDLILADPAREARTLEWLNWLSGWLHAVCFAQQWRPERFSADAAARDGIVAKGRANMLEAFDAIERIMADGRRWAVPDAYSIADAFLIVFYRWGGIIGCSMDSYPAWTGHAFRTMQRPAVETAFGKDELPPLFTATA